MNGERKRGDERNWRHTDSFILYFRKWISVFAVFAVKKPLQGGFLYAIISPL